MTKKQELAVLDSAIASLGVDSYLGPWLAQVRGEVERDITSDFLPGASFHTAVKLAQDTASATIASATRKAQQIIENAQQEAKKIETRADGYIGSARNALNAALRDINNY